MIPPVFSWLPCLSPVSAVSVTVNHLRSLSSFLHWMHVLYPFLSSLSSDFPWFIMGGIWFISCLFYFLIFPLEIYSSAPYRVVVVVTAELREPSFLLFSLLIRRFSHISWHFPLSPSFRYLDVLSLILNVLVSHLNGLLMTCSHSILTDLEEVFDLELMMTLWMRDFVGIYR